MPDFDIVIAHRGPEMGLWMTIASIEQELARSGVSKVGFAFGGPLTYTRRDYDYNYYIVENGVHEQDWATKLLVEDVEHLQRMGRYTVIHDPMSPPAARNLGASQGTAPVIFFFDNHVMVQPGYFDSALHTLQATDADAVHSVTRFYPGGPSGYHYRFTLERNFWGYQVQDPASDQPYRVAAGAHGGWAIKRSVWEELGGYWDGFEGYGGEESYFELMMGMRDKISYLDPQMVHWHHPGIRPYERDKSMYFVKNMIMCANIVGGENWARRVWNGLQIKQKKTGSGEELPHRVFNAAMEQSFDFAAQFQSKAKRTLNEQLVQFSKLKVAM